ncbi:rab9 effector protein with kelch motifs isoform X2 [Heptranchias perlo]|uniref:rab9 effector protein with kelch motifs isoform X2 n=1 Tax=Heptranchias perlo TaxID=212740 RepID=UPI0035596296
MEFYALRSLAEPPDRLFSEHNGALFHCQLALPLPKQLVIFGFGNWNMYTEETFLSVEVSVSPEIKPQRIGMLSSAVRCLVWQGDWRSELTATGTEQAERRVWGMLSLILNGQMKRMGFSSSTPVVSAKAHLALDTALTDLMDDISPLFPSFPPAPHLNSAQSEQETSPSLDAMKINAEASRPAVPSFTPSNALGSSDAPVDDLDEDDETACPSPRWGHTLCLSDPDTAILIGGEGRQKSYCKDGLWKLEIDNGDNFWFPLDTTSTMTIPIPRSVCGHSATYDPDAKRVYVFGGKKDGECFKNVYILDTETWKWSFVIGKGKVPTLAYHSAAVFQRELFIFGGRTAEVCSNTLYIFNPDHEIWYQPIVVGERPLPRYGHSATLLGDKLILFGGSRSCVFLNDLHVLDLGFMEYVNIQIRGSPPPRCRHAAVPLCGNKVLISGGYNLTGALRDLFIFNIDTSSWCSLSHHTLCSVPRAGHSLVYLNSTQSNSGTGHTLLVFGGSNNAGKFYSDTVRVDLELSED